ncbi:MAG: 1,4-alpha-glucan branching protein GlgB [Planctomycetia bacterium]|nr:1,4-alpha-glucan branching protein GlgB [Planctomycetia bacterium]
MKAGRVRHDVSLLGEQDLHLFNEGTHSRLYGKMGANPRPDGTSFAVWAPAATAVSVIGDFNDWTPAAHPLQARGSSGIWEGFVPGVGEGALYKFRIESARDGWSADKADPFAAMHEQHPGTASIVRGLSYEWGDAAWMKDRASRNALDAPWSIYEVHLGSWQRNPSRPGRPLTYREIAAPLCDYCRNMGFTHVELMPVMEHPFYGSWGYQTTGYFAPTSRYGTPQELMFLVDSLHRSGIGVILDWVPSHFPNDPHGLAQFDGTCLFEHADSRQGFHPDWKSCIFNYGRHESRSFLLSSAVSWLDRFHADGLRVDAVASMLYLDYSRSPGEWIPNVHGGRENLDAIRFLRQLAQTVYGSFPDVQTFAEESTAWPMVSRPVFLGGLGFGMKWDMGWMHDALQYMARDPVHRSWAHDELTFRNLYAFNENFVLPLSHDEVVHGKGSLIGKMPGDDWQKFANLRLLFAWMHAQPGKKLLFMGGEFAQRAEWNHESSLDWHLLQHGPHEGVRRCVADLNRLHRSEPALHQLDAEPAGFEWIDCDDAPQSVVSLLRHGRAGTKDVAVVLNFTPVPRHGYRVGVPSPGFWREILNTDAREYGGGGVGNAGLVQADEIPMHDCPWSVSLTLPPLGALFLSPGGSP